MKKKELRDRLEVLESIICCGMCRNFIWGAQHLEELAEGQCTIADVRFNARYPDGRCPRWHCRESSDENSQ